MTDSASQARDDIVGRLRRALGSQSAIFRDNVLREETPGIPTAVTKAPGDKLTLAEHFGRKLEEALGSYEVVGNARDAAQHVVRRIERWRHEAGGEPGWPDEVLGWQPSEIGLPDLAAHLASAGFSIAVPTDLHDDQRRGQAASAEIGITGVDAAFAGTGSVALRSGTGKSRSASLLPMHHLVIVPMSRLYPTVEDWLASLRRTGRIDSFVRQAGQIVFVTGPSKSADIELQLTVGVHGPRTTHAVVYDDGM